METDNIKCSSSNDIGIYAVKHITKPEVVRRHKEIGTHQQQDPRISVAWRSAVTNTKPGFSIYDGKPVSYTHLTHSLIISVRVAISPTINIFKKIKNN